MKDFADFDIFSRALIASKDVDPTYPLIKELCSKYEYEPEWFVFVYVAFYNLGTAIRVCEEMPTANSFSAKDFSLLRADYPNFGHERRGSSRNVNVMINHLNASRPFISAAQATKDGLADNHLLANNITFRRELEKIPNVGNWASFKIAEIFEKSLGYATLKIPDLGLEGRDPNSNDGPVGGLRWITGRDCVYDASFFSHWNKLGKKLAKNWRVDMGEVETAFCKWHKFKTGKYFIGHDIQEFIELREIIGDDDFEEIMLVKCGFDKRFFFDGKGNTIKNLQKNLKGVYRDIGEILNSDFADTLPSAKVFDIIMEL